MKSDVVGIKLAEDRIQSFCVIDEEILHYVSNYTLLKMTVPRS
jgi:hypothetical protein